MTHEHIGNIDDVSFYENGLVVIGCEGCNVTATVQIEDNDWNEEINHERLDNEPCETELTLDVIRGNEDLLANLQSVIAQVPEDAPTNAKTEYDHWLSQRDYEDRVTLMIYTGSVWRVNWSEIVEVIKL
tara:strand:- start:80 stop:466 length:387 start_codon:yes stop_codon:yes gene_type:complete